MGTPKVMRLLDPRTSLMECKVCGARHLASIRPNSGGRYYRGAWQCQNGCKWEVKNHIPTMPELLKDDKTQGKPHIKIWEWPTGAVIEIPIKKGGGAK